VARLGHSLQNLVAFLFPDMHAWACIAELPVLDALLVSRRGRLRHAFPPWCKPDIDDRPQTRAELCFALRPASC